MSQHISVTEHSLRLYERKLRERGNEAEMERIAVALCGKSDLWASMGWPEVSDIRCQVQLGKSRADIVLLHADGSVTLVEVKPGGLGLRDYCTGIGQLAYQAIMAVSMYQTFEIRRVLALPGPIPPDLILASLVSDIDFLPLPTAEQWRGFIAEALTQTVPDAPDTQAAAVR